MRVLVVEDFEVLATAIGSGATVTPRARPEGGLDIEVSFPGQPVSGLPGTAPTPAGQ